MKSRKEIEGRLAIAKKTGLVADKNQFNKGFNKGFIEALEWVLET